MWQLTIGIECMSMIWDFMFLMNYMSSRKLVCGEMGSKYGISKMSELDNVMDLIQQAFDIQMEETN